MTDRAAAVEAAILRLKPHQFTKDGKPSVDDINDHLEPDHAPVTAAERDKLWKEREREAAEAGPMDAGLAAFVGAVPADADGFVTVTLTASMSDPLPLYVHGFGRWSLRVGESYSLPAEALAALRDSDATFTVTPA